MTTSLDPPKDVDVHFIPLRNNDAFLLDLDGHTVLAVRLSSKVEKAISGQQPDGQGGLISKLKAKLGFENETPRWLTVANIDNPLLEDSEKFGAFVAEGLSNATGTPVTKSSITISASVPINEKVEPLEAVS